jgi:hypothetical protein
VAKRRDDTTALRAFANIEYAGQSFSGIDDDGALEIVS